MDILLTDIRSAWRGLRSSPGTSVLAFVILASTIAVVLLISEKTRAQAVSGLVLVAIGIPVYYLWRKAEPSAKG